MKKSILLLISTALLMVASWTSFGQKQNPSSATSSLPLPVSASAQDRVVDWHPVQMMSEATVMEIVDIKVAGESIITGQPFAADDDWLDTLTFRVRNVSGKTITLFGFGVAFPELSANSVGAPGFSISYSAESIRRNAGAHKPVMPNEEIDLKLPQDQLAGMKRASTRMIGTPNLSRVNILPGLANFEDGSRIGGFSLKRRIPKKP